MEYADPLMWRRKFETKNLNRAAVCRNYNQVMHGTNSNRLPIGGNYALGLEVMAFVNFDHDCQCQITTNLSFISRISQICCRPPFSRSHDRSHVGETCGYRTRILFRAFFVLKI